MENRKDIGLMVREKLKELNEAPSDSVWLAIDKRLMRRRKGRNKVLYFLLTSILGLTISTVYLNKEKFYDLNPQQTQKETIVNSQQKETSTERNYEKKNQDDKKRNKMGVQNKPTTINKKLTHKSIRLVYSNSDYDEYEIIEKHRFIIKKKKQLKKTSNAVGSKSKSTLVSKHPIKRNKMIAKKTTIVQHTKTNSKDAVEKTVDSTKEKTAYHNLVSIIKAPIEKDTSKLEAIVKLIDDPKFKKNKNVQLTDSTNTKKGVYSNLYITPYVGINQFYSSGNGTSNTSEFGKYTQKSLSNLNYGVYVRFMFNSRMGIRFGVGKKQLETQTLISKQVGQSFDLQNILFVKDLFPFNIDQKFFNETEVELNKRVNYTEIPIEFYYILKEGKFGIASALGFSYATLNDNKVSLKSEEIPSYFIGSSRDYLRVSGSANMTLYFTYKLTNRLNFEINPMIKYHYLGIISNQSLIPIDISLNTGFSYRLSY